MIPSSVTSANAFGTSFWKNSTKPGNWAKAICVEIFGGFCRFTLALASTPGMARSRPMRAFRRTSGAANFRSISVNALVVMPLE